MTHSTCEQCRQSYAMNQMFLVFGRSLCEKCADADLAQRDQKKIPQGSVTRQTDPTVCSGCRRDNGNFHLPTLRGGLPVCTDCDWKFHNRPYPDWIKFAFATLLVLAVVSCIQNWRFFEGYLNFRRGLQSVGTGDLKSAVAFMDSAYGRVPESQEVAGLASYFHGLHLMSQDKSAEALPHLQKASRALPANQAIQDSLLHAEMAVAFDQKDYDQFLAKAKIAMDRNGKDPTAVASVASAFACKWAATGDPSFKQEALNYLGQAKKLSGAEHAGLKEYEGRILYRLDSREIISREDYQRRFPNGYIPKGEKR